MNQRARLLLCGSLLALAFLAAASSAQAAIGPKWRIDSMANTTAAPESVLTYIVELSDAGEEAIPPATGGNAENCVPGAPSPANPAKCATLTARFPAGLKPLKGEPFAGGSGSCAAPGAATITCQAPDNSEQITLERGHERLFKFTVRVGKEAAGTLTSAFEVSGAEAGSATAADPTLIAKGEPPFGLDAFDALAADPSGASLTTAGAHPYSLTTWLDFVTHTEKPESVIGPAYPVAPLCDAVVDLPPGLLGIPSVGKRCTAAELAGSGFALEVISTCPLESQVGTVVLKLGQGGRPEAVTPVPLFDMVPPPGAAARFGFNILGTMVVLDAHPHQQPDGEWTIAVTSAQTSEGLALPGVETQFWGVPASPEHTFYRACPGKPQPHWNHGENCSSEPPEEAFLRLPTSCTEPGKGLPWSAHVDSWWNPGAILPGGYPDLSDPAWRSRSLETHQSPGYPLSPAPGLPAASFPVGYSGPTEWGAPAEVTDCEAVPFDPTSSLQPTSPAADAPSGLNFEIHMPQNGLTSAAPGAIAESDLKAVSVKLPEGFAVNPSAANGHLACSAAQIGLETPVGQTPAVFSGGPQSCPDAAKVGSVTIESPLVSEPEEPKVMHRLEGNVFLAAQGENPFASLLALYLVIEDPQSGTVLKLPGEVKADPDTGQLETVFQDNPQLPFSNLQVELWSGPRAALRTPSACGTYEAQVTLTPWSGNAPVPFDEPIEINSGPGGNCPAGGFAPKLEAGTENPLAGSFSPFNLELTREDGTQELGGLSVTLPEGLLASLEGIPYCPDSVLNAISGEEGTGRAQEANPSCPAASQVGRVTVGAGPGSNPFYTQAARAYLAGPYKGAPLSVAVVAPAVAGPFDLGNVVVRNALKIDPETAQATTVSDPLPHILHGIPLDLKDVRVELNRPNFTLNPTSCDPMQVGSTIASTQGASANLTERFQVAGCENLGFKPKLSLKLKGKATRGAHPALHAVLTMPPSGQANVARAAVTLPGTELLDQGHIRTTCTRVQYAAGGGGGEQCPAGSVYGHAKAWTALLDKPLEGPVYLRSNGGERELPDLVASLGGQIHIDLVGYVDSVHARIRNTFAMVPDAPVSKFMLDMRGGSKGLLINSTNLCEAKPHATALFDAHNGKIHDVAPLVTAGCGAKARKHHKRH